MIPLHNEAANVVAVIRTAAAAAARVAGQWELLTVDDGSTDATWAKLTALQAEVPQLQLLRHAHCHGYGAAIRTGMAAATGAWLVYSDGDGQFDLNEVDQLTAHNQAADLITGYRCPRVDPWPRIALGRCWTLLVNARLRAGVHDVNCGFKLIKRSLLTALPPLESAGPGFSAELLWRARQMGAMIVEVPVTHHARTQGSASGARPKVLWAAACEWSRLYCLSRRD
ncbi:MAG: glycosyltransferase family 2 protein [Polyangiales bacterium]